MELPLTVKLVIEVVASVEVPVTDSVPFNVRLVKVGDATTAIVDVPLVARFDPGVINEEISR